MFDFHEKRRIRRIMFSKFSIGVIFMVSAFILMSAFERYTIERQMAEKLEAKQSVLEAVNQRAESLRAKVEHLENERGIEEELRKRFDVAKEGEQVVIIIDEPSGSTATRTESGPTDTLNTDDNGSWLDAFKLW